MLATIIKSVSRIVAMVRFFNMILPEVILLYLTSVKVELLLVVTKSFKLTIAISPIIHHLDMQLQKDFFVEERLHI